MDAYDKDLEEVKKILAGSPRGMTILDVTEKMSVNRNAVAKYLEMLRMSGEVEMKTFGRAKIYTLAHRLPLATALSLSSDLIVLIDGEFRVIDVNDQFLRYSGLAREELLGRTIDRVSVDILAHPSVLLNVKDALNGVEYVNEISVTRGDEDHYFHTKLIPVAGKEAGRHVAIVFENITGRKTAEIALKDSEARYRAVVEDQTDLICRMLPDTTITFVNDAWCRFFRVVPEQVSGSRLVDLVPAGFYQNFMGTLGQIRPNSPSYAQEDELPMPQGMRFLLSTCRGRFDGNGRLTEIQVVARDVTGQKRAEAANRKLSRAVDESPIVMIMSDVQGRIEYVNRAFTALTGYTIDDVRGQTHGMLRSGHTTSETYRQIQEMIQSGGEWRGELLDRKKDGTLYWVSTTISTVTDDRGQVTGVITFQHDITEQKRVEAALKESEQKFRAAFDHSPIGAAIIGLDLRFLRVNPEYCRLTGYTEEEMMKMTFVDITVPECREKELALVGDLVAGRIDEYHIEKRMIRKDGDIFWVRKHCGLVRDDRGKPLYFLPLFEDITGKRKLEESLEFTQFAVDHMSDGVIWGDAGGHFIYANDAICRMLKYTRDEIMTMSIFDINPAYARETWRQRFMEWKDAGAMRYETAHRAKDGTLIPVEAYMNFLEYNGNQYVFAIIRDIAALKRTQRKMKLYQYTIDNAAGSICWADAAGRIVQVNRTVCQKSGYTWEELLSLSIFELCPGIDRTIWEWACKHKELINDLKVDTVVRKMDGTLLSIEVAITYIALENVDYFSFILRDVNDHVQADQLMTHRLTVTDLERLVGNRADALPPGN